MFLLPLLRISSYPQHEGACKSESCEWGRRKVMISRKFTCNMLLIWRSFRCRDVKVSNLVCHYGFIPPGAWMFFCCDCCVLSGRGLCDELITRPEESYRLWYVVCVIDSESKQNKQAEPMGDAYSKNSTSQIRSE
jgi:hypothetical protein